MALIFVTRKIPDAGLALLREAGHEVDVSEKDGVLTKDELLEKLRVRPYDAVLSLLTDTIDGVVFDAVPTAKVFANYAVGYNNIDIKGAVSRGVVVTNTPGVLTDTVAEYTLALILALTKRIVEADQFTRVGKYDGWAPELFLGSGLKGKTLGILGAGRIGSGVAMRAHRGLSMNVVYNDIAQNAHIEEEAGARFCSNVKEVLEVSDVVSVHVPLLDSTRHLINAETIAHMKKTAYLINTSRGPVVDEAALVVALREKHIAGAALDVFEHEPALADGLASLENVIVTPHIASATTETRDEMSVIAAKNILAVLSGETPLNPVHA